ncbi:MAG: pilus assembly protein [Chloroflexota bacterium]|nr:pilus assembly protein [Chloroflexota bacterium]
MGRPTRIRARWFVAVDAGQSLVEIALALPVLLLILLGLADLGRAFYYTTAVASAARAGAAYVATAASPYPSLKQKACAATGFDPSGNCGAALTATTTCAGATPPPGSVNVQVTYDLQLISGYLVNRILPNQTLTLRACATYPSLRS